MPSIVINGQARQLEGEPSVTEALEALGLIGRRVAVECNGAIIPRAEHASRRLREGDRIEIVAAVGGG
ncbi:MAG: sulfur carrier protein ThiS [Pseudomonadota bacterium]|nr:sulfur carrier protein ThiS [Pseudomonadota bacterium]